MKNNESIKNSENNELEIKISWSRFLLGHFGQVAAMLFLLILLGLSLLFIWGDGFHIVFLFSAIIDFILIIELLLELRTQFKTLSPINKKRRIIKRIEYILAVFLFIGTWHTGEKIEQAYQQEQKEIQEYKQNLISLSEKINLSASSSEDLGRLTIKVWRNAIYKDESSETDKYTKKNNVFVSDFNDALGSFYTDKLEDFLEISNTQSEAKNLIQDMTNPPDEYSDCYEALKDTYSKYKILSDLVTNMEGSYNSYSENFANALNDYVTSYSKLEPLLPSSDDEI